MKLADGSIYQFPNGRELIALVTEGEKVVFLNFSAADAGAFKLDARGNLFSKAGRQPGIRVIL